METANAWAKSLAEGGPLALAKTKELLRQFSRQTLSVAELAKASAEPRLTARVPRRADGVLRQETGRPWA